uniref:Phospholipase/carboxylesterase/thioesterase domain-containing protein n=1 Tax=Ditylum brightwellii TaxID=49249 RepID=A0A6V2CF54_9STRA|mmetsp:Transcript_4217/g.5471  ORF Transcript_4217/g.5471 Transcript_4217/m.5471 type:complete len:273 (-) Transcript_4217:1529-2347(-)
MHLLRAAAAITIVILSASQSRGMALSSSTRTAGLHVPNAVVIFCHGSGDTGEGVKSYVESVAPRKSLALLKEAGIEFEFPSAKIRPYRLAGGYPSSVWFDRYVGMEPTNPEDTASVESSAAQLNKLIDDLVERGVPAHKIALGGFSMGGGIAIQAAARSHHRLGAIFALSSYLCNDSWVWSELKRAQQQCDNIGSEPSNNIHEKSTLLSTPIYMAHGQADDFVLPQWGENTNNRLKDLGANVQPFLHVPRASHEMTSSELEHIFGVLLAKLK